MQRTRVMVVEDDLTVQQSIVRYLGSKSDIRIVAVASDGVEAQVLVELTRPDVLVLDIVMPLQDGFAVMRRIREKGLTDIRIIIYSGYVRDHLIRQAMDLGAYYFLMKPFDFDLLHDYINHKDRYSDMNLGYLKRSHIDETKALDMLLGEIVGIPIHTKGGRYLHAAVRIACDMDSISGRITKEIYPAVAHLFGTNPSQVERAIRHATQIAWDRGNMKRCRLFSGSERPTNGEVISVLTGKHCMDMYKGTTGDPNSFY